MRGRFGIYAPKVAIRAHIPWYWRAAATAVLILAAAAAAAWIYDTGRRWSGVDRGAVDRQIGDLRDQLNQRDEELAHMRAASGETESQFQIERTAQQRLSAQIKALEAENGRLREDLAVFEHLAAGDAHEAGEATIRGLQVEPEGVPGTYRYRMLLAAPGWGKEFRGRLQILVTMSQGGKTAMLSLPGSGSPDAQKYLLEFKNFHRIEGSFNIPGDTVISLVEARLLQGDKVVATQRTRV